MKKNHRFWSFTTNEQREILNMTTNEYGDFVFTLDGGEIWQFTPHQDKQIDVLEIDRIEGLGRGHDSKTGAPSPMSFLVLKNPKKTYTGNIRVLPRPPIETPPNSTDKPPAKAGETLLLDGELCKITRRDWEPEDSPEIVTRNGVELPPSTVRRYRCDFDLLSPSGEASRIVVTPPFMSTQVRMNPLKIESFKPRSLAGGLSGHDEIQVNAMVLFAEHSKPRQCFVERLPTAPAAPPKPKTAKRKAVTLNDAAKIMSKSVPTIRNWDKGDYSPEGWPGREKLQPLLEFAVRYKRDEEGKKALRRMVHPGDMDKVPHKERNGGRW